MRLIDADALKDKINDDWFGGYPADVFIGYIEAAPTIEPKRGKWICVDDVDYVGGGYTMCLVCKQRFSFGGYNLIDEEKYCPHCGAKMESE